MMKYICLYYSNYLQLSLNLLLLLSTVESFNKKGCVLTMLCVF